MAVKRFEVGKAYFADGDPKYAYLCKSRKDGVKRPYADFERISDRDSWRNKRRMYLHEKDGVEVAFVYRNLPLFAANPHDESDAEKMVNEYWDRLPEKMSFTFTIDDSGKIDKLVTKHIRKHKVKKLLRSFWSFVRAWWRSMRWLMSRSGYSARAQPRTSSVSK